MRPRTVAACLLLPCLAHAQEVWSDAHVAPAGPGTPQLCYASDSGRIVAVARRDPLPLLETWERGSLGWRQLQPSTAPSARTAYALGFDSVRRKVVLFGGMAPLGGDLGDTWEWDGVTWVSRTTPSAPPPRSSAAHAFDAARGRFVVYGGVWSGDQWEWDGATWTQVSLGPSHPGVRGGAVMTYDTARQVLVLFGGSNGTSFTPLTDTWECSAAGWTQRSTSIAPPPLSGAALAYDTHRGRSVLCGGRIAATVPTVPNTDVWDWDGTQWQRHVMATSPGERRPPGFAYDVGAQRFVLHGSFDTTDTWLLDPTTWTWSRDTYAALRDPTAVVTSDFTGRAVLTSYRETLRWDFASRTWQEVTTPIRPNSTGGALAYDLARREAVLLTPAGQTWIWDDVAATWQQRTPLHSPPPTQFAAIAHDILRQRTVLFGGSTSLGVSNQVWEWDGVDWTDVTPLVGPAPRLGAAMAFDLTAGTVVLFGGSRFAITSSYENDVWDWDGSSWTQRAMVGPEPVGRHSAALLADSSRVRLYGGQTTTGWQGGMSDELWELQGNVWTPLGSGPLALRQGAAAMDPATGDLVLFGGVTNTSVGSHAVPGVWIHGLPRAAVTPFGAGCPSGALATALSTAGLPTVGNTAFALHLAAPPTLATAFALGFSARRFDVSASCSLLVDSAVVVVLPGAPSGNTMLGVPIPAGSAFLGVSLFAQAGVLDPGSGSFALSTGLAIRIGR